MVAADWELLRQHWEFSHAANAVLTFIALGFALWPVFKAAND